MEGEKGEERENWSEEAKRREIEPSGCAGLAIIPLSLCLPVSLLFEREEKKGGREGGGLAKPSRGINDQRVHSRETERKN